MNDKRPELPYEEATEETAKAIGKGLDLGGGFKRRRTKTQQVLDSIVQRDRSHQCARR